MLITYLCTRLTLMLCYQFGKVPYFIKAHNVTRFPIMGQFCLFSHLNDLFVSHSTTLPL